ncbi:Sel1 repeat-containing protein [Rhodospirillales bacterium URHD0017]|nr:Sel1 repeat-containing protein [Rhodospirillales bacterium URHD0017]
MDYIDWTKEPDVERLRMLVELLANNPAAAVPGLELLAERGSVAACSHLAYFYLEGGPAEFLDINKAKYWYLKAQERGNQEAAYMLGRLHYQAHEYGLAFLSFSKGTKYGYPPAIFNLAGLYKRGEGTEKNLSEYKRLLELASSKKHIVAKRDLAVLLLSGQFGLTAAGRGLLIYFSFLKDTGYILKKAFTPGSTHDERTIT